MSTFDKIKRERDSFRRPKLSLYLAATCLIQTGRLIYTLLMPNQSAEQIIVAAVLLVPFVVLYVRSRRSNATSTVTLTILASTLPILLAILVYPETISWVMLFLFVPLILTVMFLGHTATLIFFASSLLFVLLNVLRPSIPFDAELALHIAMLAVMGGALMLQSWYLSSYDAHQLEKIKLDEQRYRELLLGAYHGILNVQDGIIRRINGPIAKQLGVDNAALLNRPFVDFFESIDLYGENKASQSSAKIVFDGRELHVEYVITTDPEYRPNGYVVALRNVSERVAAMTELDHARRIESVGLMAGGVAHDFNNMLMAMKSQVTLATMKLPLESKARDHLVKMLMTADRAADLTHKLLAFAGKGTYETTTFNFNDFADEILRLLRSNLPSHVKLETNIAQVPLHVHADRGQLQQILFNLVINASQAIGETNGTIYVCSQGHSTAEIQKTQPIMYDGSQLAIQDYLTLTVRDSGGGMDADTMERIFEPFFTTKETGTGLGLAATLGALRAHGGNMQLTSVVGTGTTFVVWLPLTEKMPLPKACQEIFELPESAPRTVLVIDDEPEVREAVCQMLEYANFDVLTAENGRHGLEMFVTHRDEIDIVLLDMQMPEMDGEAAYAHLSAIDPSIQIVMVSGYTDPSAISRLMAKDEIAFLPKPFEYLELIRTVSQTPRGAVSV